MKFTFTVTVEGEPTSHSKHRHTDQSFRDHMERKLYEIAERVAGQYLTAIKIDTECKDFTPLCSWDFNGAVYSHCGKCGSNYTDRQTRRPFGCKDGM